MKLTLILALALAFTGFTLVSVADEAAACIPPNCPGYMTCVIREDEIASVENPLNGDLYSVYGARVDCYY